MPTRKCCEELQANQEPAIKMKLTYKKSGVDVDRGNTFVQKIRPLIKSTRRPGWVGNIGAFSAPFSLPLASYKDPLVVASTDGVGTKLMIAKWSGIYNTVGVDLVAMCVNDIITCGAEPLFFLDYLACGRLSTKNSYEIVKGIAKGCRESRTALIGGETAELPGMYRGDDFDLAGFAVGIVEKKRLISGSGIKKNDVILGLQSSGIHSNGYSLVRKVFSKRELATRLAKKVLAPTAIYVRPVLSAVKRFEVKGIAHITGGGFYDNIPRILPGSLGADICRTSWPVPSIFELLAKKGNVSETEMFRTFNMGIGMVMVLSEKEAVSARAHFKKKFNLKSWIIGEIVRGKKDVRI